MNGQKNYYIGIDIGSTASKTVVLNPDSTIAHSFVLPTGWNSKETAGKILEQLIRLGYYPVSAYPASAENQNNTASRKDLAAGNSISSCCVATGYGRVCVDYADKNVTEITCHGRGAWALFQKNCTVIDVGGQDTKIITVRDGQVQDFLMNDKCAAGTGKFIEVMAARLGASLEEFYDLAGRGTPLPISAMCTVFAESEVISHIGAGKPREDIAAGVIHSVTSRVANLCTRHGISGDVVLTGGLSQTPLFLSVLSDKLGRKIMAHPMGRYAGALGAALSAKKIPKKFF